MKSKTSPSNNLLLGGQLAQALKVSPGYVSAMKRCGYVFEFGRWTTRDHALEWIRKHPWFRFTSAYPVKKKAK